MTKVKTLPILSLMPAENDLWFINKFRDYNISESDKPCRECGSTQVVHGDFESYCNNCGRIFKTRHYPSNTIRNSVTHHMSGLKNRSLFLKETEQDIISYDSDYNKPYRDFKHRYYDLFIRIATLEYNIPEATANDLFFFYFRGYYDLNNKRGLRRTKLIHRFLDRININPRSYFMSSIANVGNIDVSDEPVEGHSRVPRVAEGQLNVTGKDFTGRRISYRTFLKVNAYHDNNRSLWKFIRRYCKNYTLLEENPSFTPEEYDNCSVAEPVAIVPTLNKYVAFHGLGLEKMVVNTVINPNQSKYQEYDLEKNRLIQELKTRQPYYGYNLNTEILSGNRVNKSLAGKTQFSSVKKSGI